MFTISDLIELQAGPYRASVSTVGAALAALSYRDRPLVLDTTVALAAATLPMPPYSGSVLAPWPNRIRDGRYEFAGTPYQLPISEVERDCALHGLLAWSRWEVAASSATAARLAATVCPQPGYPFRVDVTVDYELDAGRGLTLRIAAHNRSAGAAPFGASAHPYLVPGVADGDLDDWTLTMPLGRVLDVDPERLLPREVVDVADLDLDFRTPRLLRGVLLDHAFGGSAGSAAGAGLTLHGPDGFGVRVGWDERCPWLQLCTIDAAPDPWKRAGLAVEPMSCPPDAFNSGTDLWTLAPDERRDLEMTFAAIG